MLLTKKEKNWKTYRTLRCLGCKRTFRVKEYNNVEIFCPYCKSEKVKRCGSERKSVWYNRKQTKVVRNK